MDRGVAHYDRGDYDAAIEDYNKGLQLEPKLVWGYCNRGVAYGKKGDYTHAFADFHQGFQIGGDDANVYVCRARVYIMQGESDKANADLNKALSLSNSPITKGDAEQELQCSKRQIRTEKPTTSTKTKILEETEIASEAQGQAAGVVSSAARRMAFNTAIVGGAFVLSRLLGLVREAVIAGRFGTSPEYDAYVLAFGLPDTLFLLIIGGAVGSAFIPVFTELMTKGKEKQAWHLSSTLINASVVLLSLGGIVIGLAAPQLVGW